MHIKWASFVIWWFWQPLLLFFYQVCYFFWLNNFLWRIEFIVFSYACIFHAICYGIETCLVVIHKWSVNNFRIFVWHITKSQTRDKQLIKLKKIKSKCWWNGKGQVQRWNIFSHTYNYGGVFQCLSPHLIFIIIVNQPAFKCILNTGCNPINISIINDFCLFFFLFFVCFVAIHRFTRNGIRACNVGCSSCQFYSTCLSRWSTLNMWLFAQFTTTSIAQRLDMGRLWRRLGIWLQVSFWHLFF